MLVVVTNSAEQKRDAERQQQVGQDRADQRRPHHVEVTGLQCHQRDDQFGCIAKGGIQQSADGVARPHGKLLRRKHDHAGNGDDGQRRRKENQRRRQRAPCSSATEIGMNDEKPVDRWVGAMAS